MSDPLLDAVFGISTKPLLSYTARESVDGAFKNALGTDNHVVIYGSSKQGKTSLRVENIEAARCHIVRCGPRMTTESIYTSILRDAGVKIQTFETDATSKKGAVRARLGFKAVLPWIGGADSSVESSAEAGQQKTFQNEFVGFDFGEAQAVGELLDIHNYAKFVVLENFHYLPYETQKLLAFDLKTFHEIGLRFIILGIWREANLLLVHNGDLQDRVSEIPVEPWEADDFRRVIDTGEPHLNVTIGAVIRNQCVENAYGNVGMLQEFLKAFCLEAGVSERQGEYSELVDTDALQRAFDRKLKDQKGQLVRVLEGIAGQSRTDSDDPLLLPYYLVQVVLRADIDELVLGIERHQLLEKLRDRHHRDRKETIRPSDVSHLLKRLPALQADIQPPFLYYDNNQQRLKIVDTRQFFVLAQIDREQVAQDIPLPLPMN